MVPSDYRLEEVTARLIERLDGARRSYEGARMAEAFQRIAAEHVEAALGEFGEIGLDDRPELHATFLRREVCETFLPRYERLARRMNAADEGGYGMGPLSGPLGRIALSLATIVIIIGLLRFASMLTGSWILILVSLSLPAWPDLARLAYYRRYERDLQALLRDMARIQAQASVYTPPEKLRVADTEPGLRPRPPKQRETP